MITEDVFFFFVRGVSNVELLEYSIYYTSPRRSVAAQVQILSKLWTSTVETPIICYVNLEICPRKENRRKENAGPKCMSNWTKQCLFFSLFLWLRTSLRHSC